VTATDREVPVLNLPNVLTVLRIVMVPVFVVVALLDPQDPALRWAAVAIFLAAMATDAADGRIARARGLVTTFGIVADPIADKALTGAAFLVLSAIGYVPWWMTVLILAREIGITLMRMTILKHGALPATRSGKAKTLLQSIALGWCLAPFELYLPALRWVGLALVLAALVLTLWSGAVTVAGGLRLRREALAGTAEGERPAP
jgi:CDP-diacylglycerol--glycerol-3-phosphate 3-phosphatidyltransferase